MEAWISGARRRSGLPRTCGRASFWDAMNVRRLLLLEGVPKVYRSGVSASQSATGDRETLATGKWSGAVRAVFSTKERFYGNL